MPSSGDEGSRPPRVLFVGSYLSQTRGSRAIAEDLAERLIGLGWTVRLTSRGANRYGRVLEMLATVWRRRADYDVAVVDVYSGAAFRWAELVSRLLRRLGKPYVLTLHGGNLPALASRSPRRVQRLLAGAAAVTAPSGYLEGAFRAQRADIRLLPNPIDLDRHTARVRRQPAPRLVWLRAFHDMYNPSLAPRVLARLVREFPECTLEMVGPDKDGSLARTRALAARLGLRDRIVLRAGVPKSEVPRHLDAADIFLNTTDVDNSPVSVGEAMASGLCIVSTGVGGIPFLLEHEREGLLVPPNDAAAMAAAVRRFLREPGLAARLSAGACARARRLAWSATLPRWDRLLRAVAAGEQTIHA